MEDLTVHPQGAQDCLVIIYSSDETQLGRRLVLGRQPVTIGRRSDNTLMLESDSVSRSHCRIEQQGANFHVRDLGSTNGTYVNDDLVKESQLRRGDQVNVGGTILKYLSGSDTEAQYHETIYKMTIVDGLTGLNNKRYLIETIGRELSRARQHHRHLGLLMLAVDDFKAVNDSYGHMAGDFVLKELAQLVKERLRCDDMIGRYGGCEFAAVLPDTSPAGSVAIAQDLRNIIAEHHFEFKDEVIAITSSMGCAYLVDDVDIAGFIERADENLYRAKRRGGNVVVMHEQTANRNSARRILSAQILIHRVLSKPDDYWLVAFELANERSLMVELGSVARTRWLRELELVVEESVESADLMALHQDRYLLVGLHADDKQAVSWLIEHVESTWQSKSSEDDQFKGVVRVLRSAYLTPRQVTDSGVRSLDLVLVQLLGDDVDSSHDTAIPFPLCAPAALIDTSASAHLRLKYQVQAIESAMRFGVAVGIGLIRDLGTTSERRALCDKVSEFQGRPLTMGAWLSILAWIARNTPTKATHPGARWLRSLLGKPTRKAHSLANRLNLSVETRNKMIGHGTTLPDDAYVGAGRGLEVTLRHLLAVPASLRSLQMVSVAQSDVLDDEEKGYAYDLRLHEGPSERFRVRQSIMSPRMSKPWCYILTPRCAPISLSPIFMCTTCAICERDEVFLADRIVLGPAGQAISMRGIATNHVAHAPLQWNASARRLWHARRHE